MTKLNFMKTKSYLIGLVLCAITLLGLIITTKSPAQNRAQTPPACIIVGFQQTMGALVPTTGGSYRPQIGLHVAWVERGPNAPDVGLEVGEPLSQAVEKIMTSNYRNEKCEFVPQQGLGWMIFIR